VEPYFKLEEVGVSPSPDRPGRDLLDGMNAEVPQGDRLAVVGRSGAGKSTLLRLLNRMQDPSRGRILKEGVPLDSLSPSRLRREVALVFQEPAWVAPTARENLLRAATLGLVDPAEAEERLPAVLERAGIESRLLERGEDELSLGERQRIALGRALLTRPRALLLDEPTASLDPPGARSLLQQIRRLGEAEDLTMILVTHRLADAHQFARNVLVLEEGRILDHGPASEVLPRLETSWGDDS
jgi:ABC-type methionine transport system ATPase subunit